MAPAVPGDLVMVASLHHMQVRHTEARPEQAQAVPVTHLPGRPAFDHTDHGLHVGDPFSERAVAMGAVFGTENTVRRDGLPKRLIAHRCKPFLKLKNIIKGLHMVSIAQTGLQMQICEVQS